MGLMAFIAICFMGVTVGRWITEPLRNGCEPPSVGRIVWVVAMGCTAAALLAVGLASQPLR